ncbi:MAG TPA: peptidoglycan DD-metalloendopeptidase family protein [Burkholderiales bacterium]|nr:peptidoglycan DD-metalloendopeptidase family protein [Burkholderiales bacterium]
MRRCAIVVLLLAGCASPHKPAPVVDRSGAAARPTVAAPAAPAAPTPVVPEGHYLVKKGDTLYSIALENGADYREVAQWNNLDDPTKIRAGQVLRVKPPEPPPGAPVVGRIASRGVESRPLDTPPVAKPLPPVPAAPAPTPVPPVAATKDVGEFMWPVKGRILSGFAEPRSKGIDIDGKPGEPIVAAAAGRVTYTGNGIPGLGKLVVIKHDNGFITVYAHNRDILVKEQQSVARGQKIAELGSSDSDRPKLHFQIRKGSAAVDPLRYLPAL